MMRLAAGGPTHAKYRRMITVYMDITAPLYWWKEFDTYKVGTVANSCSTMHKIAEKKFTRNDFSWEHLTGDEIVPDHTNILNCLDKDSDWFQLSKGDNIFAYVVEEGTTNVQFKIENRTAFEGV